MNLEQPTAADLRARILAEVKRTPSPTRSSHRRRAFAFAAAGVVATAAMFFGMSGVKPGTRPVELIGLVTGLGLFVAALLTRLSTGAPRASRSMLGRPRAVLLTAALATAPLLALGVVATAILWPHAPEVGARVHFACGALTLVQGALPLAALVIPRRGTDPVHPAITGAALGMAAGAWTTVMAGLRCPHAELVHGLAAHVAPTLVLAAVGAALGAFVLRLRTR